MGIFMMLNCGEKKFYESGVAGVDPSFFEIFTYPFVNGDPKTALNEPFSIVLTEKMSRKYFDDENPIGKVIRFNNRHDFLVTGVLKDVPSNSHLRFDFLIPFNVTCSFKKTLLTGSWVKKSSIS
jgi:putative ABC transport system permease protein